MIAFLLTASHARAADLWLITNASTILDDEKLWVCLVRGDAFPVSSGEAVDSISTFVDRGPEKATHVDCQLELDGSYSVRRSFRGAGIHVLGAELSPRGPDSHLIQSAKAIVQVEPVEPTDLAFAAALGHSLEIIPFSNPCGWKAGETARVKVLLDGHPWPGVAVELWHEGEERCEPSAQKVSDADGAASFALQKPGHCSIAAHLERTRGAIAQSQKETLAATLSFRVLGACDVSRMLLAIRNIHGDLDPAAVLGYRMGKRALQEMNLAGGSPNLEATVWAPRASPIMGILDGVQAAMSVSYGRENLKLEMTPSPDDALAVFTDRGTNGRVICAVRRDASLVKSLVNSASDRERRETAMWMATREDADLFDVTLMPATSDSSAAGVVTAAAIGNTD